MKIDGVATAHQLFGDVYSHFGPIYKQADVLVCRFAAADPTRWCVPVGGELATPVAVTGNDCDVQRVVHLLHTNTYAHSTNCG